jgi:hypothetical protein
VSKWQPSCYNKAMRMLVLLPLAVFVNCSSFTPIEPDQATKVGASSSGGSSGSSRSDAAADAVPPIVDATADSAPVLSCEKCVMSSCAEEEAACANNQACVNVLLCSNKCPDYPCQRQCNTPAVGLFVDYERCITDTCKASCVKK